MNLQINQLYINQLINIKLIIILLRERLRLIQNFKYTLIICLYIRYKQQAILTDYESQHFVKESLS